MAYTKTTWVNGETPVNASNLNKIEQGIYDADAKADSALSSDKFFKIEGKIENVYADSSEEDYLAWELVTEELGVDIQPKDIHILSIRSGQDAAMIRLFPKIIKDSELYPQARFQTIGSPGKPVLWVTVCNKTNSPVDVYFSVLCMITKDLKTFTIEA